MKSSSIIRSIGLVSLISALAGSTTLAEPERKLKRPGVLEKLKQAHPNMQVNDLTPELLNFKVSGIDFLSDGTMVVATWDKWGSVYLVKNYSQGRDKMQLTRFAAGLAEPLGVKVVDNDIYVLQKQELTRLRDSNFDGTCDTFEVVCNAWDVSGNFHEFAFGPLYQDGHFYVALAVAINPGGKTTKPQQKDRGTVVKINPKTAQYEVLAAGLRTPNGIGHSIDKSRIFVTDNQGDYLPASKLLHIQPQHFYNHKYTPLHPLTNKAVSQPVVWLPQNEIGNSPTEPLELPSGPFAGQIIFGDIFHGGLKRVHLEEVAGQLQGTVFRLGQNMRGGINRLKFGPDGALYAGVCGQRGNWGRGHKDGLLQIKFNDPPVFEIHSVETMSNGLTLHFTQALAENLGWDPSYYQIDTYTYKPTINYGGPKVNQRPLQIQSATVSHDRRSVFLEIPNLEAQHVVHGVLYSDLVSHQNQSAWAAEWWTNINILPKNKLGKTKHTPTKAKKITETNKASESPHALAQTVYQENCQACHSTNTQKLVGPGLAGLIGKKQTVTRAGEKVDVTIDQAYIKRSITNPAHEFPNGFQPIMPNLSENLGEKKVDALVEWISSLKN